MYPVVPLFLDDMKDENYRAYRLSNAATLIHPGSTHRWRIFSSRSGDPIAFRPATFAEILGFEACNFASGPGKKNLKNSHLNSCDVGMVNMVNLYKKPSMDGDGMGMVTMAAIG